MQNCHRACVRMVCGLLWRFAATKFVVAAGAHAQKPSSADPEPSFGSDFNYPVIGVDFGSCFSSVGIFRNGHVEMIPNDHGNRITPSYVTFAEDQWLVGETAKQLRDDLEDEMFDFKRMLGRRFNDRVVQAELPHLSYSVVDQGGKPAILAKKPGEETAAAMGLEEVCATILTRMKEIAESHLGHQVSSAVVAVPAFFGDAQRQAMKDAASIAGLSVVRLVNGPTAAALAYGSSSVAFGGTEKDRRVLVYDLGGSGLDVSLLVASNGVFEVVATSGSGQLGGLDFDRRTAQHLASVLGLSEDKASSPPMKRLLQREAERAKRVLSVEQVTTVTLGKNEATLTRWRFEELNLEQFEQTLDHVKEVLKVHGLKPRDVDDVILVGGSTRIPRIREMLQELFERELNADVNPDEIVAHGAALQAGILSGIAGQELLTLEVAPLSLGVETASGEITALISRNAEIPTSKTHVFTVAQEGQPNASIRVFESEQSLGGSTRWLGTLELDGIDAPSSGMSLVEVVFHVDASGILNVQGCRGHERGLCTRKPSACLAHPACAHLQGDCCPTSPGDSGVMMKCCYKPPSDQIPLALPPLSSDDPYRGGADAPLTRKIAVSSQRLHSEAEIAQLARASQEISDRSQKIRHRADAELAFDGYLRSLQSAVEDFAAGASQLFGAKLEDAEREQLLAALADGKLFLSSNPGADVDEISEKRRGVEGVCVPIVSRFLGERDAAQEGDDESEGALGSQAFGEL